MCCPLAFCVVLCWVVRHCSCVCWPWPTYLALPCGDWNCFVLPCLVLPDSLRSALLSSLVMRCCCMFLPNLCWVAKLCRSFCGHMWSCLTVLCLTFHCQVLSRLVVSCLVLACFVSWCRVLSCRALRRLFVHIWSSLASSNLVLFCLMHVLFCHTSCCDCLVLSCPVSYWTIVCCFVLSSDVLSRIVVQYFVLSLYFWLVLSCHISSSIALSCHVLICLVLPSSVMIWFVLS